MGIMPSKVSQKDKYHMLSLLSNLTISKIPQEEQTFGWKPLVSLLSETKGGGLFPVHTLVFLPLTRFFLMWGV